MIEWHCDICGKAVPYTNRRRLNAGAIHDITGAENVCAECAEAINKVDWNGVARKAIKEARR